MKNGLRWIGFLTIFIIISCDSKNNSIKEPEIKKEIIEVVPELTPDEFELSEILQLYNLINDRKQFKSHLEKYNFKGNKFDVYTNYGIQPSSAYYIINYLDNVGQLSYKTNVRTSFFPLLESIKEKGKFKNKKKLDERELLEVYLIDSVSVSVFKSVDDDYYPPGGYYEFIFKKK